MKFQYFGGGQKQSLMIISKKEEDQKLSSCEIPYCLTVKTTLLYSLQLKSLMRYLPGTVSPK